MAAGHRLCDHTVSHDTTMDTKSQAYQSQQTLDAERMITQASGGVRPETTAPRRRLHPLQPPPGRLPPHATARLERRLQGLRTPRHGRHRRHRQARSPTARPSFDDAGGDRSQTVAALREVLPA